MIQTPRVWLSAGLFCFGASIVIGYHQDQMAANNVLAEKVGLPPKVLIQDFDPSQHSNILNEVRLLAEAALSQTATLNVGTDDAPKWVQVTPIYPVGMTSKPFADKYLAAESDGPRRPMPRARRGELAEAARRIRSMERQPMGLVLIETGVSVQETGLLNSLGEGLNGPLIVTTGSLLNGDEIHQRAAEVLENTGISIMAGVPLIAPYSNGLRVAPRVDDYDSIRNNLEWAAVFMVLTGIAQMFSLFSRPAKTAPETFQKVEAVGEFPSVFQPIRHQEDLIREEQEEAEKEASAHRRRLSRLTHSA